MSTVTVLYRRLLLLLYCHFILYIYIRHTHQTLQFLQNVNRINFFPMIVHLSKEDKTERLFFCKIIYPFPIDVLNRVELVTQMALCAFIGFRKIHQNKIVTFDQDIFFNFHNFHILKMCFYVLGE